MCKDENIPLSTEKTWLRQRRLIDSAAYRRTNKHRSERRSKLSDQQLDDLLNVNNSVRNQHYECQIQHFHLNASVRTLQRNLKTRRHARRFKMRNVKAISLQNKQLRLTYVKKHKFKSMKFWESVHWTDEAHIDSSQQTTQYILREEGTRYQSKNLMQRHDLQDVTFHIAAFVS